MAVTPQQRLAKDFWPYFRQIALTIIVSILVVALGISTVVMYALGLFETEPVAVISLLATQAVLSGTVAFIIYRVVADPLKEILAAVIQVSGEPTTTTPPNPNDPRFAKTGFKDVLETLYTLASTEPKKQSANNNQVASDDFIQSALNTTVCGFVLMDSAHQIIFANKAAPVDIDRNGQKRLNLIFNGTDTLESWLAACEQSSVHAEHVWTRIPDKLPEEEGRRFFDVIASYEKGAKSEVVLSLVDRTAYYESGEEELDFIAFAAHELRGPITVIRGYLDVLQSELGDKLQADQVELFRRSAVSANRLSGYINNILNTSRYDRRHLKMHLVETSASAVYDVIRDDMAMRASAQNRLLNVTIPQDLPTIAADPASLSEVFGNLIDNAIKYSNEGGAINVSAIVKGDFVEVTVEDHGIGMPGNVVSNLFKKFYRSHRSRETVAGTGIGLYISKAIVESHGGTISVRSEDGKGSAFIVSIPTYASVADKIKESDNSNVGIIEQGSGWIKNHSMYRG